ncbi:MAG: hypothetical protein M1268_01480 [Patescibacteria group bacterium]|nr:hypothetical protein [Actinomycetota bacterium]MCL5438640.1 hypothetical protein [Patescibacteria group bacterium]
MEDFSEKETKEEKKLFSTEHDKWRQLPENDNNILDEVRDCHGLEEFSNDDLNILFDKFFTPYPTREYSGLPKTGEDFVRLFRGERDRKEFAKFSKIAPGAGRWWTPYLYIAANCYGVNGGMTYYVDIPESVAQESSVTRLGSENLDRQSTHPEEFYLPEKYLDQRQIMSKQLIDDLLENGEYTKSGRKPGIEESESVDAIRSEIRSRLSNLALSEICRFWAAKKFPEIQPSKIIQEVSVAENLLAKICGWR